MTLRKIHTSGLGSVDGDALRAHVLRWIDEHQPDRISHTEMGRNDRSRALAGIEGYGLAHVNGPDGQDECAMQYRLDGPHPVHVRAVLLSGLPIPRRGGKLCYVLHSEFPDGSHEIGGHMPSGAQGNGRINDTEQGRVYLDAIGGLKRLVAGLDGRVSMPFDWNLDLEQPWVREFLRANFPGFTLPRIPTDGGTFRHRWIDFTIARGYTTTAVELPTPAAVSDHDAVLETLEEIPVIPDPYAHDTFHGEPLDNATIAALKLAEVELGYELTIFQGIGGADASAGTHAEGRAVDLAPFDRERKLRVLKDLGFIAWYRPEIRGLWGAHIHAILIFENRANSRGLADAGFRQIASFDARRDGLKSNRSDPSYRPDPKAAFTLAEYKATFEPSTEEDEVTPEELRTIVREEIANAKINVGDGVMLNDDTVARRILASLARIETALKGKG